MAFGSEVVNYGFEQWSAHDVMQDVVVVVLGWKFPQFRRIDDAH